MRRLAVAVAAVMIVALPTPAKADTADVAYVELPSCPQSSPVSTVAVPGCSYIALAGADGSVSFGQVSATAPVSWSGTSTNGSLTFPPDMQRWPGLTLNSFVSASLIPSTITGQLTPDGQMTAQVPLNVTISALGARCTVSGSVSVSTEATDAVGGGVGQRRDPNTGWFALAGTTTTAPTLTGSSDICRRASEFIDLNRGIGFYFVGSLAITPASTGAGVGAQTAVLKTPAKIKRKGSTVLVPKAIITNAGQKASVSVRWAPKRTANGTSPRYASVRTSKSGKVKIVTTGKAKRLHVRMSVSAPSAPGYDDFLETRRWVVR